MIPAEHREGKRAWTRADVIHLANTLPLILEDVEEGEAGYGDLEAVILRAFADVGHPLVPADDKRVFARRLQELTEAVEALRERFGVPNLAPEFPRVYEAARQARAALDSVQEGER